MVDVTKQTYGSKIEKSPDFFPDIKITFTDDISVGTMKLFSEGEGGNWQEALIKELIIDWNLTDENEVKFPICIESLDRIMSIKLRNWIIETMKDIIVGSITESKKK